MLKTKKISKEAQQLMIKAEKMIADVDKWIISLKKKGSKRKKLK